MSAFGPKRTRTIARQLSALGAKRTWLLQRKCLLLIQSVAVILHVEGVTLNRFVARPIASSLVTSGTGTLA